MTLDEIKELGFRFDSKLLNLALDINKDISIVYYESGNIRIRYFQELIFIGHIDKLAPEKLSAFIKSLEEMYE